MKRVVFDTNIVVSASFWRGAPSECLRAWARGECQALVSPAILAEYSEVTERLATRYPERPRVSWSEALAVAAELVFPAVRLRGITTDPDDEVFLECAVAGGADFLVTGDRRHLLTLTTVRGVRIVGASNFLEQL